MPIKKDGSDRRWVEMELVVPGSPEEVWQALATGPGNAAWFIRAEIEPEVGGALRFHFAPGVTTTGEVTRWEPPHAFGYVERDWQEGAPPVATEITVTARSGHRCVVRMVHSLFTSSDAWDDQLEGFESGWPGFFAVLRVYLTHFAGAPAASFIAMNPAGGAPLDAWRRLLEPLGLSGANVGERRSGGTGAEAWTGIVEHVYQDARQRWVLVRVTEPVHGQALVGLHVTGEPSDLEHQVGKAAGASVSVGRYFYGDDAPAQAAESEPAWRAWLASRFGTADGDA